MVRAAAPLLRTDPELALFGRYCVSRRLREEGFEFSFPTCGRRLPTSIHPRDAFDRGTASDAPSGRI